MQRTHLLRIPFLFAALTASATASHNTNYRSNHGATSSSAAARLRTVDHIADPDSQEGESDSSWDDNDAVDIAKPEVKSKSELKQEPHGLKREVTTSCDKSPFKKYRYKREGASEPAESGTPVATTRRAVGGPRHGPQPTSGATGVSWDPNSSKWRARLSHGGKVHHLGSFAEERDAVDAVRAAREAAAEGRLGEHKAERKAARASQPGTGTSGVRGVSWTATKAKWQARLWHADKQHRLGHFAEERDAAGAVRAAREAATEGRLGEHTEALRADAAARRASQGTSGTPGVSWDRRGSNWKAQLWHASKQHQLANYPEEQDAADAVLAAREAAAEGRLEEHKAELRAAGAARRASGSAQRAHAARPARPGQGGTGGGTAAAYARSEGEESD